VWSALRLRVPEEIADVLLGLLGGSGEGVLGLVTASQPPLSHLTLYFDSSQAAEASRERAERALMALGCDPSGCDLGVEAVPDERWAERYQASLAPFDVGTRFRIHPSGRLPEEGDPGGREPILLVPGRAFGTGEHPTTRLCVEALEDEVGAAERWVDLGTGTGVLAVAAWRCGAGSVEAVDDDPEAVAVARETFAANGLEDVIAPRLGSIEALGEDAAHGIVANIAAPFFLDPATARAALARLRGGGRLLASGILDYEAPAVEASLSRAGFSVRGRRTHPPWALIVAERPL
jgi:ribosomal protein L11 methyltransferase